MLTSDLCKAPKDGKWLQVEPTPWWEGWSFQSYPWPPGRGEGLEGKSPVAKNLINHAYVMKPP